MKPAVLRSARRRRTRGRQRRARPGRSASLARQSTQVAPDSGSRRSAGCQSPSSTRTSTLDTPRAAGERDAAEFDHAGCGHGLHHINGRRDRHLSLAIPTARHPVSRLPAVHRLDRHNPLRLLHAVEIGDVQAQRKPVLDGQRHAVPRIREHDALVAPDRRDRHRSRKTRPPRSRADGWRRDPESAPAAAASGSRRSTAWC